MITETKERAKYAIMAKYADWTFVSYIVGNDIRTFNTIKEAKNYIKICYGKEAKNYKVVRIRQTTRILKEYK